MAKMPMIDADLRARVREHALGVILESGWILAMCVFAYAMAAGSIWFWSVWGHR
jgi:hypothetical protein